MKNWAQYQDSKGYITQSQWNGGDAGDSLQRTCSAYLLTYLTNPSGLGPLELSPFINDDNKWRRSWQEPKWYGYWDRASRDQLTPLVMVLGLPGHEDLLKRTCLDHCRRLLLFATNTRANFQYPTEALQEEYSTPDVIWDYSWKIPDVTFLEFWALYIRAFNIKLLKPVLYLFDIHTILGAIVVHMNQDQDVINHSLVLEYSKIRMDTFWMKLARKITPRSFLAQKLDTFFGPVIEPPINELYRELK